MNFIELAAKRRSVRKFSDKPVAQELIDQIIDTTLTSPSSRNSRSSKLAITTDKELLEKLSTMRTTGAAFLKNAPLAFFIMGDDTVTDLWKVNSSISATVMQFAAESLGLGSCWVHVEGRLHDNDNPDAGTAEDYIHEICPETKDLRILCVVAIGHHDYEPKPRTADKEEREKTLILKA